MTVEEHAKQLSHSEIVSILTNNQKLTIENKELKHQLEWFKKQIFGQKSERRPQEADAKQLSLGESLLGEENKDNVKTVVVAEHKRKKNHKDFGNAVEEKGLRFDETVPVTVIEVPNKEVEGLVEGQDYEVIDTKVTHRLAQKPSAYEVLRFERKVVKVFSSGDIVTPKAPEAVIEKSYADVSFLAGMLIDKFCYYQPLYRIFQKLEMSGIKVSRQTLTNLVLRTSELLKPIYEEQLESILESAVIAMDETPIKAGTKGNGKMNIGRFWPVYGDQNEVVFIYKESRAHKHVFDILGEYHGKLITDGYEAYDRYAEANKSVVLAACWAHARRKFVDAEGVEPERCKKALDYIAELYSVEADIKKLGYSREDKLDYRIKHSFPIVDRLFAWLESEMKSLALLDSSLFTIAANYVLSRTHELKVFITDPDVPIDTNHLERAIRPIPMGRKNWLFCMTEIGAEAVGIIQSLLFTCKIHGINPYTYLVDILQRIDFHPISEVKLLTPRLWKDNFAENPLRAQLDLIPKI